MIETLVNRFRWGLSRRYDVRQVALDRQYQRSFYTTRAVFRIPWEQNERAATKLALNWNLDENFELIDTGLALSLLLGGG
jgi:hypothetical protein